MKRNKFSLSHYRLLTCGMGSLIPLTWYEALPGDSIQQQSALLIRTSPLLAPVMHPVRIRIHHWFVPNRLIWDNWENFITGGEDGNFTAVPPYWSIATCAEGSLADYFGVPTGTPTDPLKVSALPLRAYNLIWNEWYRDQDLQTKLVVAKGDGEDTTSTKGVQLVAWEKDYFTSARPWPQKGDTVTIPIGEDAPVLGISKKNQTWAGPYTGYDSKGESVTYAKGISPSTGDNEVLYFKGGDADNFPDIYADLSAATGVSVRDLRLALAIQRYQEARAQYGSRYVEYLRYLGVRSSDARLQKPEYLGGGRQVIQFSEVVQTGAGMATDETPIGTLKGHGLAAMRTAKFRRFFEEHGIVMTLLSVVPKSIYFNGLPRKWSREIKEDYHQRELEYIGEQAVFNKEVYVDQLDADREKTFGYQRRYDEYRWEKSGVSGQFRGMLNYWHMARDLANAPALNSAFISCVPTNRVYADQTNDPLYIMCNHSIQARRGLAKYAKGLTF